MASKRKKYRRAHKYSTRSIDRTEEEIQLAASLADCIREKMLETEVAADLDRKTLEIISQSISVRNVPIHHRYRHKRRHRLQKPGKKDIKHG